MRRLARPFAAIALLSACLASFTLRLDGQRREATPARSRTAAAAAVDRGRDLFTRQCSFCHGADARGGAQGGSDLLRSALVLEDEGGRQLAAFLAVGRPEKNMPKFDLPRARVADLAAFLRARLAAASGSGRERVSILVGDPAAGEAWFKGKGGCTTCHSVTGDLAGIGARYDPVMLQGRLVVPRGRGGWPGGEDDDRDKPLRAVITPAAGPAIAGDVVYLSDFYVIVRDDQGRRHSVIRRGAEPRVEIVDPLHAHVAQLRTITDQTIHDLTAYLARLK